jgi:tRNA (guanine-N7-)-methyltransferase
MNYSRGESFKKSKRHGIIFKMQTMYHLKYPYTFEERAPTFLDGVLFIPEFYTQEDQKHHQSFSDSHWFSMFVTKPVFVEYCSGNGQWLCEMAKKHPDILWIGCELKYERVKKIYKRIKTEQITNCLIAFGTAETLTKFYLPKESISFVYINFPDPWPKKKHAKHRLFQAPFLEDLKKVMSEEAKICLATDDMPYLEQAILEMSSSNLTPCLTAPYYRPLPEDYGYSFFEDLWTIKGKQNYQTLFLKT